MARRDGLSAAERMRRHREAFEYGVAHRCSLAEAERVCTHARYKKLMASISGRQAAREARGSQPIERPEPWWMRD